MNLTRALDVALPEIPARALSRRLPRLDPGATFREHIEDGTPVVRVYTPSSGFMFKLSRPQWSLAQLFDGNRTYSDVAELYSAQMGEYYDEQAVSDFASELETANFWYQTPQEKNVLLLLQSKEERRKNLKAKNRFSDLSIIIFPAFSPDRLLTKLYARTRFIYTRWFTVLTVLAFLFTAALTLSHWPEIGRDTAQFYNFTDKTFGDVVVLYLLGIFVVAVHEYAHAHACKHCGGRVPAMGFALIFLTPAFYTDTTEGAVMGNRQQRLVIALAGIWSELMVCSIATPIWWLSEPGTVIHAGAYFLMMLTGIVSLIVNWNPLMKLDGYHMLCEIIGIADLKEESTAYLSAWVRRHVWRLPVEVPYVPPKRRPGFAIYALLSGAYSYTVLYIVARFAGNVSRNFSPEWAFIPEYGVALLVFKSRIRLLVNFMKLVYLDKKDRVRGLFRSHRALTSAAVVVLLLLLLLPIWHERTEGKFVLESAHRVVVRAVVPGTLESVLVNEGAQVSAGQLLATLRNLPLESEVAGARAEYVLASNRALSASMGNAHFGEALKEQERLKAKSDQLRLKSANLEIVSPISGVIMTPRLQDRIGASLIAGSDLVEIADAQNFRAYIYVSEYDMYKVREGALAKLQVEGVPTTWATRAQAIAPASEESDAALLGQTKFKGLRPPQFYRIELPLTDTAKTLRPGMTGVARVYGNRKSLLGLGWETVKVALGRKIW
jgi:putative peptide zinc metalloprotease protein